MFFVWTTFSAISTLFFASSPSAIVKIIISIIINSFNRSLFDSKSVTMFKIRFIHIIVVKCITPNKKNIMYGRNKYGRAKYGRMSGIGLLVYLLNALTGAFALTGIDTVFTKSLHLIAQTGTFILSGIDALIARAFILTAAVGSFALTGIDALFHKGYNIIAESGSFVLAGIDVLFHRTIHEIFETGSFVLTGISVTFKKFLAGIWGTIDKADAPTYSSIAKPSTPYSNRAKPTTIWTNIPKA